MSSQHPCVGGICFFGSKVVDGTYVPIERDVLKSMAMTLKQPTAWMQIDLGENHCISAVKVWNRAPFAGMTIN